MISYTKVVWKRHLVILRFSDIISFAATSKTNGKQFKIHSTMCLNSFLVTTSCISLLHRPLFIKFFFIPAVPLFPTTKQIISPATITREKIFSGVTVLRFGRFLFLMVRWVECWYTCILFWFLELHWFQKGLSK